MISTLNQDSDFRAQAALSLTRTSQTNNIVNSKAYYDISFRTTTAGVIKSVEMDFPVGTYVGAATLVEAVGIGPGSIAASGSTGTGMKITYTVTNEVNVPANTRIRIQLANINNPPNPSSALTVAITTKDSSNAIIDGQTSTTAYNIKQIGTTDIADNSITTPKIADNSITSTKPAESFMKRVILSDNTEGNGRGWNPDGVDTVFQISEPAITCELTACSFVSIFILQNPFVTSCEVAAIDGGLHNFVIRCLAAPADTNELHYVVENLPLT